MEFIAASLVAFAATIFFWPVIVLGFLVLLLIFDTSPITSAWVALLTGVALYFWAGPNLPSFTATQIAAMVIGYFLVGMIWSVAKWYLLNKRVLNVIDNFKAYYAAKVPDHHAAIFTTPYGKEMADKFVNTPGRAIPPDVEEYRSFLDLFASFASQNGFSLYVANDATFHTMIARIIPKAGSSKKKIIVWIAYWPLSMVGYVIRDFLVDVVEYIYARISGIFSRITRSMFKEYE